MKLAVLSFCLALLATPALAQSVVVTGPTGKTITVTAADLAALPRVKVVFEDHGKRHEYEGPLLIDVVAKVGAPTGTALRGPELANVVLVKASDGYLVVFGQAEADPGTRPNRIILADRMDGAPMGETDGPFKLIVEGDLRPARSVRLVAGITVYSLGSEGDSSRPEAH